MFWKEQQDLENIQHIQECLQWSLNGEHTLPDGHLL